MKAKNGFGNLKIGGYHEGSPQGRSGDSRVLGALVPSLVPGGWDPWPVSPKGARRAETSP